MHHISREISSEATVRGEGGITGEGRLVGNQSFIPGISVPQKLTPLACMCITLYYTWILQFVSWGVMMCL